MEGMGLTWMIQVAMASVFLYSCLSKARRPAEFASALTQYGLLPSSAAQKLIPPALIGVEGILGVGHVSGSFTVFAAFLSVPLLLVFAIVIVTTLRKGIVAPCLCFGAQGSEEISHRSILRIVAMILAELWILWAGSSREYLLSFWSSSLDESLMCLMGGETLVLISAWLLRAPEIVLATRGCSSCGARNRKSTAQ